VQVVDKKSKPKQAADSDADAAVAEASLGHMMTETRERKGFSREQVVSEIHLPAHYIKMIESDSYELIADRLYLVPFLRRYATFLGLDAEEVASRFVSEVQHAEGNVVRISQELTVVSKKPGATGRIAFAVLVAAVLFLLADFAWRHFTEREAAGQAPVSSSAAPAPASNAQAPNETLPPATIITNPETASAPPVAADAARAAGANMPPSRPAPTAQQVPRAPADD
jgi:cytoskeleton protein RodZ